MEKELKIQTVAVTIRVIEVGGKKMTISVFKQIPDARISWFAEYHEMCNVLGWTNHGNQTAKYILFSHEGTLFKTLEDLIHPKLYDKYTEFKDQIYIAV